jgi:hypothetical protein
MTDRWLEFRVSEPCGHTSDTYDWCPICRIKELEAENKRLQRKSNHYLVSTSKLEAEVFKLKQHLTSDQLIAYEKAALGEQE